MSDLYRASVSASGGVLLGKHVICDGFRYGVPYRVQTHVHDDHMRGWPESKGYQDVFMSRATRALLEAEYNADIGVRQNLHELSEGCWTELSDCRVQLLPSCHMLGAVQVSVELTSGTRVGYSGDFSWPMNQAIEVDTLVVDSTNGSPSKIRRYSEPDADAILLDKLREHLRYGHIYMRAHRGTLHRALNLVASEVQVPMVASRRRIREIDVFRRFGYVIPRILCEGSEEACAAARDSTCIFLYSKGDPPRLDDVGSGYSIALSAYLSRSDSPIEEYSEKACRIALCDHADFDGCLEYVRATGAKRVIVDARGGHGVELAIEISTRLGIPAEAATTASSREWGA